MEMILGDTPMITGKWYNPRTGHSFTAKDTYMEDNRMYVLTTDGQRIDYEMLSQYVQSDNPERDIKDFSNPQPAAAVLPPEVQSAIMPVAEAPAANLGDELLSPEDKALIAGTGAQIPMGNPVNPGLGNIHQPEDEDALLVRRMLKRAEHPLIDCKISWKGFPTKQMDMLDTMGVDYEKIADFYMKDLDIKDIQAVIKCAIVCEIEKRLKGDQEPKDGCTGKKEEVKEKKVEEKVISTVEPEQKNEIATVEKKPAPAKPEKKTPSRRVQKRATAKNKK